MLDVFLRNIVQYVIQTALEYMEEEVIAHANQVTLRIAMKIVKNAKINIVWYVLQPQDYHVYNVQMD